MKKITALCFVIALTLFLISESFAKTGVFSKEANFVGGYSDTHKTVGKRGKLLKNSIGFEYYKKFANDYGDYMTGDLQVRLSYDSLEDPQDAWGLEVHNAWLEYKLGLGKHIRLGHFDPFFGLEPLLDTHGTLMQTLAIRNIGYKKDWGIGYRGYLGDYDIQTAVQLGSGMGIRHKDNNFLLTTRLGSSDKQSFQYGVSLLYGQMLEALNTRTIPVAQLKSNNATIKKRIGFDTQLSHGAYQWNNELVVGEDHNSDVLGFWSEVDYTVPQKQELSFQLQGQYWRNDFNINDSDEFTLGLGMSYELNTNLTMRLGYFHDVDMFNKPKDKLALAQLYFFGF